MSSKIHHKVKKYSKSLIIEEILKVFPTLKDCANTLGMTETNFSHAISRGSNKFIFKLKTVGVNILPLNTDYTIELKDAIVKENIMHYQRVGEQLQTELSEMKKLLSLSVKRITTLEEENEKLRSEVAALTAVNSHKSGGKVNNNK